MEKETIEELLFDLAGLNPDWIDEKYNNLLTRWKFNNSDEIWIDGELIDKNTKRAIQISLFNIQPPPKEIIVSELKNGFPLTEKMFVEKMIIKLSKYNNADYPDDTWQMRVNLFIDYLTKKYISIIQNSNDMISIEEIKKHLETITEINQKIIYLINTKAEHEMYVSTLPESVKKWFGDNVYSKQCDALISKYELLLKYQPTPEPMETPSPKPFAGLLINISDTKLESLFGLLKEFINIGQTTQKTIDYIFGGKEKPKDFEPIEWKANKQFLIDLLTGLQKEVKYNKKSPKTRELSNEIKRQTELYFIDSDTKQGLKLPKNNNRLKDRPEYTRITKFLATL
jgi:hypothetical protein